MNDIEILARADQYMQMMDNLVAATLEDLGESPEALRGAHVVTSAASLIVSTLLNLDNDDETNQMAEMAAVATVIGHLVRRLDRRLDEVVPA